MADRIETKSATGFVARMVGAARLDPAVYEDVEADRSATGQALLVVLAASLAGSLWLGGALLAAILISIAAWLVWAALAYVIGARLLPEPQTEADLGQMLRVIGFASAPGILRVFGVGVLAYPVFVITGVWMLVAMVVGIRQALDYRSTARAVAVAAIGWFIYIAVMLVLLGTAAGGGAAQAGSVTV